MGNVAVPFVAALAVVTAASGAHVPEHPDVQQFIPSNAVITEVPCRLKEICTLPCPFEGEFRKGSWVRMDKPLIPIVVRPLPHEKYQGRYEYRGIASMSLQQPGGGAMLIISEVQMKHQDVHRCSVTSSSGHIDHYINLTLYTPVVGVSLELRQKELLCRSENIYPRPAVNWTFSPEPPDKPHTSLTSSETGLFSVRSSVPLTLSSPHNYSCNVSTEHSWRSATYRRNPEIRFSDSVTVPCAESTAPVKSLVWKFNHKETIYNRTGLKQVFGEFWTQFGGGITKSNSLVLKHLTQDQQGLFSCELSTESETHVTVTEVTDAKPVTQKLWFILAAVVPVLVIAFLLCRRRKVRISRRRAAPEQDSGSQAESLEEITMPLDNMPNSEVIDMESDYDSLHTASRRGSDCCEESSGYGQSGCGGSMDQSMDSTSNM